MLTRNDALKVARVALNAPRLCRESYRRVGGNPLHLASRLFAFFALAMIGADAAELPWPGCGTITLDPPQGWRFAITPGGRMVFNLVGQSAGKSGAVLRLSFRALPEDEAAPDRDEARERLAQLVQVAQTESVEQEFVPRALRLKQGYGWFAHFTDAALVGRPPQPGNFKFMRNAYVVFDAHTEAEITMQFDAAEGPLAADMMRITESLQVKRLAQPRLEIRRIEDCYEVWLPPDSPRVRLPAAGLAPPTQPGLHLTADPRSFYLSGIGRGLDISGWLNPAERFRGIKAVWRDQCAGYRLQGLPEPINVVFGRAGDWEIVESELPDPGFSNVQLHASLVRDGTWIDLHFAFQAERPLEECRAELRSLLAAVSVTH